MITGIEKALMLRAARHLAEHATELEKKHAPFSNPDDRRVKNERDRLLRDERDLRALVKRLENGATLAEGETAVGVE